MNSNKKCYSYNAWRNHLAEEHWVFPTNRLNMLDSMLSLQHIKHIKALSVRDARVCSASRTAPLPPSSLPARNPRHLFKRLGGPQSRSDRAGNRIPDSPALYRLRHPRSSFLSYCHQWWNQTIFKILILLGSCRPSLIVDCTRMCIDYSCFDAHSTCRKTELHILHSCVDTVTGNALKYFM